jgi:hypothetical protein
MTSPNHQILRPIVEADWPELAHFDLGSANTPWVREVAEIVEMLPRWQADPAFTALDRRALALVEKGQIVAVAAHEAIQRARGTTDLRNRYLMVVAVRFDRQRSGLAERAGSSRDRIGQMACASSQCSIDCVEPLKISGGR